MSKELTEKRKKIQEVLDIVGNDKQVAESLVVRLADPYVDMFGKQFNDVITDNFRASMQVHPYTWYAAGSAGIVIWQDDNKNIYTAFITKNNRPDDS